MKICSGKHKCDNPGGPRQPLTAFGKNRNTKDGLECRCNACKSVAGEKYRENNKEKIIFSRKRRVQKNKNNYDSLPRLTGIKICGRKDNCVHQNGSNLDVSEFSKHKGNKDGLQSTCRACMSALSKVYRKNNSEKLAGRHRKYAQKNKDNYNSLSKHVKTKMCGSKDCIHPDGPGLSVNEFNICRTVRDGYSSICKMCRSARSEEYYKINSKKINVKSRQYRKDNAGKINALTAKRRSDILDRTPIWANHTKINEIYADCAEINLIAKMSGCVEKFAVDHQIPLKGKLVSGLHIAGNLQIITARENTIKGNKFITQ